MRVSDMILRTVSIGKSVKSSVSERRRMEPETRQPMPVLASYTDATAARIGLVETVDDKKKVTSEVAKMTTVPPNMKAVLTMTTKSVEAGKA